MYGAVISGFEKRVSHRYQQEFRADFMKTPICHLIQRHRISYFTRCDYGMMKVVVTVDDDTFALIQLSLPSDLSIKKTLAPLGAIS